MANETVNQPSGNGEAGKKKGPFGRLKDKIFSGKKKKKKGGVKGLIVKLVILLVILAAAFFGYRKYRETKAASAVSSEQRTSVVTKGTLTSQLSASGTVSPKDTYTITSLVEGDVIEADFEEGDQVEKDQVLYRIDSSSMDSKLSSATNSLERANKSYAEAQEDYADAVSDYSGNTYKSTRSGYINEILVNEGDKVSSNTQLATIYNDTTMKMTVPFLNVEAEQIAVGAQATLTLDDTEEELTAVVTGVGTQDEALDGGRLVREVSLEVANPGGLTTSHRAAVRIGDFVSAEMGSFTPITDTNLNADVTGSGSLTVEKVLIHKGDYVAVGTPIFSINAEDVQDILDDFQDKIDSAKEQVESAQSNLDSSQDTYDNYTITAPISGEVVTKTVKVGDTISRDSGSSATSLAVIYDLSELTFEMSIDELDIQKVQVGQEVQVTADALEDVTMTGHVTKISMESSYSNGVTNYPVTVTMDEVGDLLPGMNVDGVIILDSVDDALMIPVDALMRGNEVYVRDDTVKEASGRVPAGFKAVEVKTGLSNDDYVQITEGVSEGDEVYVDQSSTGTETFMMGGPGGDMGGGGMGGGPSGGGGGGMGGGGGRP